MRYQQPITFFLALASAVSLLVGMGSLGPPGKTGEVICFSVFVVSYISAGLLFIRCKKATTLWDVFTLTMLLLISLLVFFFLIVVLLFWLDDGAGFSFG